jgi:hypothetical protein
MCDVEVTMSIAKHQYLLSSQGNCVKVEDEQVDYHHPVALLDLFVLF